jgi:hypothetical protein
MSTDNRTELNDCDVNTGWSGDGTSPSADTTVGLFFQGTASISSQHTNSNEHMYTTNETVGSSTFSLDITDQTWYFILKDNLVDTYANGGIQFVFGDGTDRVGFDIAGNDAVGMPLSPFFNAYKIDGSNLPSGSNVTYAGVEANLTTTAITQVGVGTLHLAKAQGNVDNIKIDNIRYIANDSYALTINGGSIFIPELTSDVAGDDETNGWGMVANPLGAQYLFFAPTEWGTPTGTADSVFQADDEQWFWIGDNGGGQAVGATHFPFRLIGNSTSTTNRFTLNNVVIVNTGTRAQFDISDANMNWVQLDGCTLTDLGVVTGNASDNANRFINNTVFNNCDQMDPQALRMDGNTFNGTTDANGAVLWDEGTADVANHDNLTFVADANGGHAIEIAPTGAGPFTYNISGYTFDGFAGQTGTSTNRVFFVNPSTLSADVTINISDSTAVIVTGGGCGFSWREVASYTGTVTINTNVDVTFDGLQDNTEVRVYNNATGAELDGIENATAGSPGNRSFTASVGAGTVVDYVIHNVDYEYIRVESFTWPSTNQTIQIQQRFDRNYDNP